MVANRSSDGERAALATLDSGHDEAAVTGPRPPESAAAAPDHPQIGRYRILRALGQGSAGVVHTAYDQLLDRVVALKTIRTDRSTANDVGRFIREAKALARLAHPNIVHIYDVSIAGGQVCLAMELIRGRTLRQHLARLGAAAHAEIVALFLEAGRGLAAVHQAALVHRDFKPDNVMVGDDGRVRVLDFGLVRDAHSEPAREPDARGGLAVDLTATGGVLGTPAYMAPEQHRGAEADARSDVFSFCAALYEALHGERPFVADSYEALRAATLAGTVRPPAHARVPAWLREVVLRGLRPDPAARWPAMEPLLAALAADPEARRRRWWRRVALALGIAAVTLLATLLALQLRRTWTQERVEALAAEHLAGVEAEPVPARAEAAFAAFVEDPAHRGTRALAQAWLHRGDRRLAASSRDEALADYARAYVEASTPDGADEALRRIARVHLGGWDTATFSRVVATLPAGHDDLETTDLRIEAALRRRDLPAANALPEAPSSRFAGVRPLLRRLTPARPLGMRAHEAVALPPGGEWSAAVVDAGRHELVLLDHALRPGQRWRSDENIHLRHGDAPWALTRRGDDGLLLDVTRPEAPLARFNAAVDPFPRGFADADRDGRPELYFGFQWPVRGFHAVDPTGPRGDLAAIGPTRSDLEGLVAADLDGDGVQEIVAAFGPPRAFDLRVFHAGPGGALKLVHRQLFGWVRMLGLIQRPDGTPALVAVRDSHGENSYVFPEPPHRGAAAGVHLLRWTGAELVPLVHAPVPHDLPVMIDDDSLVADLDGDARAEIAVRLRDRDDRSRHTLLVRQTDTGALEPFVLGHWEPLAAVRVADDELPALLVTDDTRDLWALGVGDLPLPPVAAPAFAALPPPTALTDDPLRQRWTRADDLAAAGLPASAAEVLRDGASMLADEALRRRFRDRAAELFAAAGQPEAALALDAGNLEDPALAPGAQLRRATLLTDLGAYQEAASAAQLLLAHPNHSPPQAAAAAAILGRVTPLLDARTRIDLRFDAALLPAWRIRRPSALRLDPVASALRIDALASQGHLADLPVRWDGGPLELEVDLELEWAEYNAALHLALVDDAGRPLLGVGVLGRSGRAYRFHTGVCMSAGQHQRDLVSRPVPSAQTRHHLVLRATLFPDRGVTECTADDDGQRTAKQVPVAIAPTAGRYSLVIGNVNPAAQHRVTAEIRRITLRGARLDDAGADASPTAEIARSLVIGEPAAALAILDRSPPDDPRHALLALLVDDALGRPVAPGLLVLALSGLDDADLIHLLRTRPALAPALRAAAEPRVRGLLAPILTLLAIQHLDDPALERELLAALAGLTTTPPDETNRRALGELLNARGTILQQRGRLAQARRDYEAALVAFGDTPDPPGDPLRSGAHIDLALLLVDDDPAAALAHTAAAIACEEAPEFAAERLRRDPRITARVAADPAWARVLSGPPDPAACAAPPSR